MLLLSAAVGIPATTGVAQADDDLTTTIQAARNNFKPITDDQLTAAKADVTRQMQALEKFVNPGSVNGKQWISYLALDDAKKQLTTDGKPELAPLLVTYGKLNRDENGLELPQFRNLSDSLWKYVNLLGLSRRRESSRDLRKESRCLRRRRGRISKSAHRGARHFDRSSTQSLLGQSANRPSSSLR